MPEEPKIQFTPAQAAAISARGCSLLVSAAAGSGKTRVLVERVVGLITAPVHPVDANQLLIMTFTNAAAAKLRADITALWEAVEWDFFTKEGTEKVLYWHWSPENGWEMKFPEHAYNE